LSTAFSMCFILVPVWGKAPFPQTGTRMKHVGFYAKFNVEVYHHHGTSHQDSCSTRKAFSSPPGRSSFSWITKLCTLQKDWSFLLPNLLRKVHFWMHDWRVAFCWLCHFSFKWVQQGPSMPMAMIACCFITNEFLLEIVWLCLWRWFTWASSCSSDYCLGFVLMSTTHLMTLVT
jgi:hypothetical protein